MKLSRLLAGVGLVLLVGTAGTACTTHAGAAAQVGSRSIETSELRGIVERGLAAAQAAPVQESGQTTSAARTPALVTLRTLNTMVQYEALSDEARRRGITLSSRDFAAFYRAYSILQFGSVQAFEHEAAAAGYAQPIVSMIVRSVALQSALGDRISPHLLATEAEVRDRYDTTVSQIGRIPLTYAQAKPYLARIIVTKERLAQLRPVLAQAEKKHPIRVNPRFGAWNSNQFTIIDVSGSIASAPEPPAHGFDNPTLNSQS